MSNTAEAYKGQRQTLEVENQAGREQRLSNLLSSLASDASPTPPRRTAADYAAARAKLISPVGQDGYGDGNEDAPKLFGHPDLVGLGSAGIGNGAGAGAGAGPGRTWHVPESDALKRARAFLPLLASSTTTLLSRAALDPKSVDMEIIDDDAVTQAGAEGGDDDSDNEEHDDDDEDGDGNRDQDDGDGDGDDVDGNGNGNGQNRQPTRYRGRARAVEMELGLGVFDVNGQLDTSGEDGDAARNGMGGMKGLEGLGPVVDVDLERMEGMRIGKARDMDADGDSDSDSDTSSAMSSEI